MRIFLIIILMSLQVMQSHAQTEVSVAQRWLVQKGAKSNLKLSATREFPELIIYEDSKSMAFAIVAKTAYSTMLDNPVLAYSVSNVFSNSEANWSNNLISSYREQLRELKSKGSKAKRLQVANMSGYSVSPILVSSWGQQYPYNQKCPYSPLSNDHKLTGCVATAMSQVMYYHRFPNSGKGSFAYTYNGKRMEMDFASLSFDWSNMKSSYSQAKTKNEDFSSVANLMYANAVALSSKFGDMGTSASIEHARYVLANIWGYSQSCEYLDSLPILDIENYVLNDLKEGRPVILSGGQHAFVCDGYRDGFFHFNLGWYGKGDGYYKTLILSLESDNGHTPMVANSVLRGIEPMRMMQGQKKAVCVYAPGTLSTLIRSSEISTLTSLTISGKLNGKDVAFLRRLLGANDEICSSLSSRGVLTDLDLSSADFIKDRTNVFLRISAKDCKYGNATYDFSKMTHDTFKRFCNTNMRSGEGYAFSEESGGYYINFYTVPKKVSPMMFSGCQNLCSIKLPSTTKEILARGFYRCGSLKNIVLPYTVTDIETGAFASCYLLEKVILLNPKTKEVVHGLSPLKTLSCYGAVRDYKHGGILDGNDMATCKGLFLLDGASMVKLERLERKELLK